MNNRIELEATTDDCGIHSKRRLENMFINNQKELEK